MHSLLFQLRHAFPELCFTASKQFAWSPETQEIFYDKQALRNKPQAVWSLLHETGHALLGHKTYRADVELLRLEVAAWDKARELAPEFAITIDEDHIEDCLDTYRDWLNARSICPTCTTKSLQQADLSRYRCHNCHTSWKVTPTRFARAYRAVSKDQPLVIFAAQI